MKRRERKFIETVWLYYKAHGRHDLPWRHTNDPYRIHLSEVMLQQTQVERVIPKYSGFLVKFPTVHVLAKASLGDVLRCWQGLGYNRRAQQLHSAAIEILGTYQGTYPSTCQSLQQLPGIGPYTAGAILAFAFNTPTSFIETNIRTVYLHHFFQGRTAVSDRKVLSVVERTMDHTNPRAWYAALMDYGTYLKRTIGNQNVRSKHYSKQPLFKGSNRELRGAIIRALNARNLSKAKLIQELGEEPLRVQRQLNALQQEELLVYINGRYALP